jgi:hypothetical protein
MLNLSLKIPIGGEAEAEKVKIGQFLVSYDFY